LRPDSRVVYTALLLASILSTESASAQVKEPDLLVPDTSAEPPPSTARTGDAIIAPSLQQVLENIERKKSGDSAAPGFSSADRTANSPADESNTDSAATRSHTNHPLKSLVAEAGDFARTAHAEAERVEVSVTPVDRRLRLNACEEDIEYAWTSSTKTMGNTSITAKCNGSAPWKVLIRVQVRVFRNIPVLVVPVNKGDALVDNLVTSRLLDVSTLRRETLRNIDNVTGYRFKRRLAAGREISSSILSAPRVITKGDLVLISATNQVLDVQMKGTALSGGEIGRKIKVRSNSSGRIIQTWIKGPGQVVVSP